MYDRAFYGNYDVVKQYASEKFARAHEYAEEHGDLLSERFVRYLMRGFVFTECAPARLTVLFVLIPLRRVVQKAGCTQTTVRLN